MLSYGRDPTLISLLIWAQSTSVTDGHTDMPLAKTRCTSVLRVKKVTYIQNTLSINKWKHFAEAQINHQEDHFHCTPLYPRVPVAPPMSGWMLTDNGTANETLQARAVACAKSVSTAVECRRQWRETRLPKVHVWSFVSVRYKSASAFFCRDCWSRERCFFFFFGVGL